MNEVIYQGLVQIPEPVYFSLFLIIGKNIKEKRMLLMTIMLIQYILLMKIFPFNIWFQISYTFLSFVNLKVLYKEKAQVTDIFLFAVASIILTILSIFAYGIIFFTIKDYHIALVLNRILLFVTLVLLRKTIKTKYASFCKLWNRHNFKNKPRSLTVRNISIISFNFMFCIINFCIALRYVIVM